MKRELISNINIKIAISLNRLLESKKKIQTLYNTEEEIVTSYNEIALEADIRKATVSDTFNAKSKVGPNSTTVIMIVEAMGYKLQDFANLYDSISETDVKNFKE